MRRSFLLCVLLVAGTFAGIGSNASGAVTAGTAQALVNSGQLVRDSSSAIPVFGFGATTDANDNLVSVMVDFCRSTGLDSGSDEDFLALNNNPALSGMALYADTSSSGANDDVLDAGDTGITASGSMKSGSNNCVWTMTYSTPVPGAVVGNFHWFIVVRTADAPDRFRDGDAFRLTLEQNSIVFDDPGPTRMPAAQIDALALVAQTVEFTDLLPGNPWIGGTAAQVRARAVLGLNILDGGIAANRGVNDRLTLLSVNIIENSCCGGSFDGNDFPAVSTTPATSAIALYRDSNDNDVWDPSDTGVTPSGVSTSGVCGGGSGVRANLDFIGTPEPLPNSPAGTYNYFVVARTATVEAGDQFIYRVCRNDVQVGGVLGADTPRTAVVSDTSNAAPGLRVDVNAPSFPCCTAWNDPGNQPFVHVAPGGGTIYFSHLMSSPATLRLQGLARDDQSGLGMATFSTEASLAGSPTQINFSGQISQNVFFAGDYRADATSTGANSPAAVTLWDTVGNQVTSGGWNYVLDDESPFIDPDPGWRLVGGANGFWIDPNGKLWFSDWFYNSVEQEIRVDISDAGGSTIANTTASEEPSLEYGRYNEGGGCGGTLPALCTAGAGTNFYNDLDIRYAFSTISTNASDTVLVILTDNVGNTDSREFEYGEDNEVPFVSVTSPMMGDVLSGRITLAAMASDALTAINICEAYVDAMNQGTMYWNGTHYIWPVSTALFQDGHHLLKAACIDMVGNRYVSTVQVSFANAPPTVVLTSPAPNAMVGGTVRVESETATGARVSSMELSIDSGTPLAMQYDSVRNIYWHDLDTVAANLSGRVSLTVRGWSGGTAGPPDTIWVTVDNSAPQVAILAPAAGAEVSGMRVVKIRVTENVQVDSVTVSIGGAQGGAARYNPSSGLYEFDWATGGTPDGKVNVSAEAMDAAGNKGTGASPDVLVDNAAPSLLAKMPADRAVITGKYVFQVDSSDGTGGGFDGAGGVWMRVDAGPWMEMSGGPPGWSLEVDVSQYADGAHDVSLRSADDAGNEATGSIQVTTDSTPPMASFLSPAAGSSVAGTVRLEVSALDTIGVRSVSWAAGVGREFTRDPESGRWVYMYDSRGDNDGPMEIEVTATDWAGLTSTANLSLKLDNSGPDIDPVSTSSKDGWVTITVKVTDATGVESVEALVEGRLYAMVPAGDGTYSVSAPVSPGGSDNREYEVRAKDSLGNTASHQGGYRKSVDYWAALLNATPFLLFLLLLLAVIAFFVLLRKGKLGAWWHKYEQAKMTKETEAAGPMPSPFEDAGAESKAEAPGAEPKAVPSAAAKPVKSPDEIEKDERS